MKAYESVKEAKISINNYLNFYNKERTHQSLNLHETPSNPWGPLFYLMCFTPPEYSGTQKRCYWVITSIQSETFFCYLSLAIFPTISCQKCPALLVMSIEKAARNKFFKKKSPEGLSIPWNSWLQLLFLDLN